MLLPNRLDLRICREYHGMTNTITYISWQHMRDRCYNVNNPRYSRYGGRGITVCDEWDCSFLSFYEDMGERPCSTMSLQRIDNDLGYCKNNCKWAYDDEQMTNQGLRSDNKTGVKGVAYQVRDRLWVAYVNRDHTRYYLYNGNDYFEACCARKSFDTLGI